MTQSVLWAVALMMATTFIAGIITAPWWYH